MVRSLGAEEGKGEEVIVFRVVVFREHSRKCLLAVNKLDYVEVKSRWRKDTDESGGFVPTLTTHRRSEELSCSCDALPLLPALGPIQTEGQDLHQPASVADPHTLGAPHLKKQDCPCTACGGGPSSCTSSIPPDASANTNYNK